MMTQSHESNKTYVPTGWADSPRYKPEVQANENHVEAFWFGLWGMSFTVFGVVFLVAMIRGLDGHLVEWLLMLFPLAMALLGVVLLINLLGVYFGPQAATNQFHKALTNLAEDSVIGGWSCSFDEPRSGLRVHVEAPRVAVDCAIRKQGQYGGDAFRALVEYAIPYFADDPKRIADYAASLRRFPQFSDYSIQASTTTMHREPGIYKDRNVMLKNE